MGKKKEKNEEKKKKEVGRKGCCLTEGVKKGAWSVEEDKILVDFIAQNGHTTWRNLPQLAGLLRCGKSCRLRWKNYLRPNIKRGPFCPDEETKIIHLHGELGNKWAAIASHLPGRTDNDVKNFWNSHLRKRFSAFKSDAPPPSIRDEAEPSDEGDHFLRLWNSQVGDSFRTINDTSGGGVAAPHVQSPNSQISSLTKAETDDYKVEVLNESGDDVAAAYSGSPKSSHYEMDDSSDAMLKLLLLDFPVDDMGFLQPPYHRVATD